MRVLCLDGPLNGCYATESEARAVGYAWPDSDTYLAWWPELVMVMP